MELTYGAPHDITPVALCEKPIAETPAKKFQLLDFEGYRIYIN